MKTNKPLVSICIPAYNSADYLGDAIESVIAQSFKDFELIIVDNNSSDKTALIISKYSDPRISYVKNDQTLSMAENWNKCISLASGKYVGLLHADDSYLPDFIETELKIFKSDPKIGIVYSSINFIDGKGAITSVYLSDNNGFIKDGAEQFKRHILGNYIYCPSIIVKKECYEKVGVFSKELSYLLDWDMWLKIELAHFKVAYTPRILANYRMHGKNVSSKFVRSFFELKEIFQIMKDNLSSKNFNCLYLKDQAQKIKKKTLSRFRRYVVRIAFKYLVARDFFNFKNALKLLLSCRFGA